ncbi:MAG: IS110 family transposase [Candidatus Moraniibacteriota bacterium]
MRTYTGIDVSKASLDVCVKDEFGTTLFSEKFHNTEEGVGLMKDSIPQESKVVIESTSSYHWLSCLELTSAGFEVSAINPLLTKKYERSSIRGAKTDSVDASRLADISRLEQGLPLFFDSRESLTRKRYQTLLARLMKTKQEISRSYKSALEALETVGVGIDIVEMETMIDAIDKAISSLKKMIEKDADDLAKEVAKTPGISLFQATVLSTAVSGRTFENRDQLIAFFGLDVRKRESGNWKGREHLSKRGNPFYRKILFQLGWSLWRHNKKYATYYESVKASGKHYFTCIIAIARKFLREFFRIYKTVSL